MTKARKYFADEPEAPPPATSPTACFVNGCPLPGVYRLSHDRSVCCVHDEEDAKDWPEQTTRIRNRLRLFMLAFDMTNAETGSVVPERAVDKIVAMGGPPMKAAKHGAVTIRTYGAQIKESLIRECKGEKTVPVAVRQRLDTWRSLREVV